MSEGFINEQEIHQKELEDNENIQQNDNNEGGHEKEMLAEPEYKNLISNFTSLKARKINFNWKKYMNL